MTCAVEDAARGRAREPGPHAQAHRGRETDQMAAHLLDRQVLRRGGSRRRRGRGGPDPARARGRRHACQFTKVSLVFSNFERRPQEQPPRWRPANRPDDLAVRPWRAWSPPTGPARPRRATWRIDVSQAVPLTGASRSRWTSCFRSGRPGAFAERRPRLPARRLPLAPLLRPRARPRPRPRASQRSGATASPKRWRARASRCSPSTISGSGRARSPSRSRGAMRSGSRRWRG